MKEIRESFAEIKTMIGDLKTEFNDKFEDLHKELEYESADNARIRILSFSEEIPSLTS